MMDALSSDQTNKAAPLVVAVVLNWNGGSINRDCLDALLACRYANLKVLFVDNASVDGSLIDVRTRYPQIEILVNESNLGFTGGNNRGIRRALDQGAEMVLILNNDVKVLPGFLDPLVDTLRDHPGMVGPKVLDPSGRIWCAGGMLAFHHNLSRLRGYGQMDNGRYDQIEEVDYLPACCLLVSRSLFESVGLLDEDYFCYLEDVEFCSRARKAGFPVLFYPESRVYHEFSHSTGGGYSAARKYMNAVNSVRFLRQHGSFRSWMSFWILDVLALPLVVLVRLFKGQAGGALAKGRGILEGLAGQRVTPEKLARYHKVKEPKR
ncbi:MAG: glycosyltransferase family 2 protein [Planctomycetes bacterium]|nr:glycosyltransferase family 2 protein [Planctomycetota bacterium]